MSGMMLESEQYTFRERAMRRCRERGLRGLHRRLVIIGVALVVTAGMLANEYARADGPRLVK